MEKVQRLVTSNAEDLAKLAGRLQELVGRFKI